MGIILKKVVSLIMLIGVMGVMLSYIKAGGGVGAGEIKVRELSKLSKHIGSGTVALVSYDDNIGRNRVYCTGVWIESDMILTASHCVSNVEEEKDEVSKGGEVHYVGSGEDRGVGEEPAAVHLGKVVMNDKEHDIALIRAEAKGMVAHDVIWLARELPGSGERVYIVGHVKGLWWSYIEGVVSGYRDELPGSGKVGPFIQISAPIYYGNSGGGAFDIEGNLVGICSCSFGIKVPSTSFFIDIRSIKKLIENYKKL